MTLWIIRERGVRRGRKHEAGTRFLRIVCSLGGLFVRQHGHVEIAWSLAADGRLGLRWTEAGGPFVKPPTHRGFGTRIMEKMIGGQFGGEVRFDWRDQGLTCEIGLRLT